MESTPQFIYDRIPYEGYPITATHPDRIIPLATLLGMKPAAATKCRVLELGCGDGANLLPMAAMLPDSRFVGVDLAHNPIAKAVAMTEALGLTNIRFQQMDVMDMPAEFGEFDYILAHGLYSWVPAVVRDKVMAICESHLALNGIAYISYNVYPGCYLRKMMSGMMQHHAQEATEPEDQVARASELLTFLSAGKPDSPAVTDELKQLKDRRAYSILHDDLSSVNDPVYFHEFAAHAGAHGLQFLAESDFFEMQPYNFSQAVRDQLAAFSRGDILRQEQYMDFLKNRRFRKTLLCRREITINREPDGSELRGLYLTSVAKPVSSNPDIRSTKEEEFRGNKGGALRTGHPALKATMMHLGSLWPAGISFDELSAAISEYADDQTEEATSVFCGLLLRCFMAGMLELRSLPPSFTLTPGERPRTFPYALLQARNGERTLCSLAHTTIELDPPSLHLLRLLDGAHDVDAIQQELIDLGVTSGTGKAIERSEVEKNINKLARAALLVE